MMLVSHRLKFIFLKTKKTAGTSVEISLSRFMGPEDVITPISDKDEAIRRKFGVYPKNYVVTPTPYVDGSKGVRKKARILRNHTKGEVALHVLGRAVWDEYFVFTIERHPFDRLISQFYWRGGYERYGSIAEFLEDPVVVPNSSIYTDNKTGEPLVDYIIRFDQLQTDLNAIATGLGIEFDGYLPHAKGNSRTDRLPWCQLLSPGEIEIIRAAFEEDFKYYNSPIRDMNKLLNQKMAVSSDM